MNPLQPSVFEMTVEVLGILHLVLLSVVIPIVGPILALSMCRLPGRVTTT